MKQSRVFNAIICNTHHSKDNLGHKYLISPIATLWYLDGVSANDNIRLFM